MTTTTANRDYDIAMDSIPCKKLSSFVDFDNEIIYNFFALVSRGERNGLHDRACRHCAGTCGIIETKTAIAHGMLYFFR